MGLLKTFKKAMGIGAMKAEEAIDDALNPIDKAKLEIKEKKEKLATAKSSHLKAREAYFIEKNKLAKYTNEIEGHKQKLLQIVTNYRNQGIADDVIATKIAPVKANIADTLKTLNESVATQTPIVAKHEQTVEKFGQMIKTFEREVNKKEQELKLLESEYNMADTTSAIAEAMNELNTDGSSDDLAKLRAKTEAKNAQAEALMAHASANASAEDSLDALLLDSSGCGATAELDDFLGLGAPAKSGGDPLLAM